MKRAPLDLAGALGFLNCFFVIPAAAERGRREMRQGDGRGGLGTRHAGRRRQSGRAEGTGRFRPIHDHDSSSLCGSFFLVVNVIRFACASSAYNAGLARLLPLLCSCLK